MALIIKVWETFLLVQFYLICLSGKRNSYVRCSFHKMRYVISVQHLEVQAFQLHLNFKKAQILCIFRD